MASTYVASDAFTYSKTMIKDEPLDDVQVRILDDISKIMWMAAPWRWTLGNLPDVTLVAAQQSYTVALPVDYLYTAQAYSVDGAAAVPRDLVVVPRLPTVVGITGQPNMIAITGSAGTNGTMNVSPVPPTMPTTTKVYSLYKKTSPEITLENSYDSGVLVFDDEWFWVYEAGVLWLAYMYGDDSRAGSASVDAKGNWQYTGQRAMFEAGLVQMAEREKLPIIDPVRNPPNIKETKR